MKKSLIILFVLFFTYNIFSVDIAKKYKLKVRHDSMEGITWYRPKIGTFIHKTMIYPYIGEKEGSVWLRFKLMYKGRSWLFINSYILLIDRERFTIKLKKYPEREVVSGSLITEISDIEVDAYIFKILEKIANARSVTVRYNGTRHYSDKRIKSKYILMFKNVIKAYRELGGSNGTMLKKKIEEIPIQETRPAKKEIITEPQTVETPKPIIETTKPITNKGITLGMSLLQVRGKLGTPLSRVHEGDRVIYKYKDVVIVFGSKGKVVKIIK